MDLRGRHTTGVGDQTAMAFGMLMIGLLFQTLDLEPWARVLCWAAVVAGSAMTVVFGVRFVRQELDADR